MNDAVIGVVRLGTGEAALDRSLYNHSILGIAALLSALKITSGHWR
jgi:hypothetical protein